LLQALRSCLQPLPFALSNVAEPSGTFFHKGVLGPGDVCLIRVIAFLYLSSVAAPLLAQSPAVEAPVTDPHRPVITDTEFNATIPSLNDAPLESIEAWQAEQEERPVDGSAAQQPAQAVADSAMLMAQDKNAVKSLPDPPLTDPLLDDPLPPIENFDAEPPPAPTQAAEREAGAVRYILRIDGLDATATAELAKDADGIAVEAAAWNDVRSRFYDLSLLKENGGRADSRAEIGQRARADRQLLLDILNGQGFFDADVQVKTETSATEGGPVNVIMTVLPGRRYYLGHIAFDAPTVQPANLISGNFAPKTGDAIIADVILAAEANISVALPQNGYPFANVGQRDLLLDSGTGMGDYTLPIDPGVRSYFGQLRTEGTATFDAGHIAILRRFKSGDLYDSRKVDDLRAALIATGLLSTVSVEAIPGEGVAPDGTPYADLRVRQEAAPPRSLAASVGLWNGARLSCGRQLVAPKSISAEGALRLATLLGTQEQAASVTFDRANAGRRDRNIEISLSALHSNYDAFEAYTGRLAVTMALGFDPHLAKGNSRGRWGRKSWARPKMRLNWHAVSAIGRYIMLLLCPVRLGFDRSNDLLDPVRGYRVNLRVSPEVSLGTGKQIYARAILDGSYYYPVQDNVVVAARARVGTIKGISRDNLAPSRRFYGGGGGSIRGFGYQRLGPLDPNNDPIGGRSVNEFALEGRYRFGNLGVVGFVDAGQAYESSLPNLTIGA
jgi:translocation and assembly module TamA